MHDPRAEVSRRVDCVPGGSSQRDTDHEHNQTDREGIQRAEPDVRLGHQEYSQNENECADYLRDQI